MTRPVLSASRRMVLLLFAFSLGVTAASDLALAADAPTATNSFAGGGPFMVSSVPLASDVAVLSGGLVFDISDAMNLAVDYDGMLGSGYAASAFTATLAGKF